MLVEISFLNNLSINLMLEFIPFLVLLVIGFMRGWYKRLRDKGYPIFSTMLKWNIRLFIPVFLCFIYFEKHLMDNYKVYPLDESTPFYVSGEYISGKGSEIDIHHKKKKNVVVHVSAKSSEKVNYFCHNDPDYIHIEVCDESGKTLSENVYDANGRKRYNLTALMMRGISSSQISLVLFGLLFLSFNICMYRFSRWWQSVSNEESSKSKDEENITDNEVIKAYPSCKINLKKDTDLH